MISLMVTSANPLRLNKRAALVTIRCRVPSLCSAEYGMALPSWPSGERLRCGGCRSPQVQEQDGEADFERSQAAHHRRPSRLHAIRIPAQPVQGSRCRLPFQIQAWRSARRPSQIRNRTFDIKDGLLGKPDLRVTADAKSWLGFLAHEKSLPLALIRRKIKITGAPRLLLKFGKCFPSAGPRQKQVEILPEPSLLKRGPSRYLKNDQATGKLRWFGQLVLAEKGGVTANVNTCRFRPATGAEIPSDNLPGQFLTLHIAPGGIATKRSYTI